MKKKFFAILFALLLVLSFGLIPAVPAAAYQNSIASSTLYFEGALTAGEGGVFTGTIAMTAGTYYIPGGPGTAWDGIDGRWETPDGEEAQGGFDIYAKSGGGAYVEGFGNWSIGSNHDAYSSGGPEGTQHDPDFRDWDMYSLELTADHWYLRYTQTNESPMSGTMVWHGDGTGYAAETDLGTQDGGHDGSAIHGGGAQAWDWDRDWGVEVIPLQYLGFDVQVTDLGGGSYSVTLTPAAGPYPSIVISPKDATITAGDTQAYTATAYDEYGNEVEDVTADTIFSIEAGAGGSWEPANVYTSEVAGEWQVTGTYGELTDCACLTVNPVSAVSFVFDAIGPQTAGVPFSITITAYDGGDVVTDYTGTAALSDLTGTIAPDVTTAFVDGVWTGEVTITGAMASNIITATDGDITGTSDPFDVNPVSAVSFVFDAVGPQTAGVPFSITITAYDGGEVVTDYTGTAALSDLTGTIAPDVTTAFVDGVWTGDVIITGAMASNTITATDGDITGTSDPFDVNPASAISIVISPDTVTIIAGESQAYEAYTCDEFGNEVGDVTADTVFSIEAGAGGSWEANVYTSEKAGTWQVTGTYEGLTDYASLTVEPSAVETLMIVQQPTDTTVGVVIAPPVTVKAVDELGNTIPDQDVIASLQVGTGTLSGNLTQVTDGSGIATFDNLSIDLAGVIKVLLFTVDSVTVDSNPFTVYPAPVYDSLFTLKAGWTLISTHREIDAELSEFVGATLVLKYTESGFLSATFADLKPVEALYVKMPDGGWVGLNYLDVVPGVSAKDLVAGWNLVSSATFDSAAAVLSPLRYVQLGEEQGIGLATVVSQGYYNLSGNDFYLAALTDADWEFLGNVTLIPFDGYWVYMNAAKVFGVIPGGES